MDPATPSSVVGNSKVVPWRREGASRRGRAKLGGSTKILSSITNRPLPTSGKHTTVDMECSLTEEVGSCVKKTKRTEVSSTGIFLSRLAGATLQGQ